MWNIHNNITLSDIADTLLHGLEGGRGKKKRPTCVREWEVWDIRCERIQRILNCDLSRL